jgi:hypothetical protein
MAWVEGSTQKNKEGSLPLEWVVERLTGIRRGIE